MSARSPAARSRPPRIAPSCGGGRRSSRTRRLRPYTHGMPLVDLRRRLQRQACPYLALCRSMLAKRQASTPFGDAKRCPGMKHAGGTKLRTQSPRRRLHQDEFIQRQIRHCPAQPRDLDLQLGQMLGQIVLGAAVPVSPPIVSYFGYANFLHTVRNPSAARCQSLDMPQLCENFLSLMSFRHRFSPMRQTVSGIIKLHAELSWAQNPKTIRHVSNARLQSLESAKRSAKRTIPASISLLRTAIRGIPTFAADRTSPGLQPNSCRKARLKLDGSSKQKSAAMAAIGRWFAGSDNEAQMRINRWRWM